MQKITPFLWFDNQAEEAAEFYTSIFPNSEITDVKRYATDERAPTGTVTIVSFRLEGQDFIALNGGPQYKFTEAISLYVDCTEQAEIDELWQKLIAGGGEESESGWLKDKYGLSWQIVPNMLREFLSDPDPGRSGPVMHALLGMQKIDIQGLKEAYNYQA